MFVIYHKYKEKYSITPKVRLNKTGMFTIKNNSYSKYYFFTTNIARSIFLSIFAVLKPTWCP